MSPLQASHEDTNKINQIIDFWLSSPMRRRFCAQRSLPPSAERTAGQLDQLDRRLVTGLRQLGIVELYEHQWRSLQACGRGHDVVVATPTASGKTLCYNLPVLQSLLSDPAARAIYIFPTKALARDQTEALRRLAAACSVPLGIAVYDGDTPPAERRAARKARIIATNPEMLHTGILPHHPSWAELLSGVTHVVVDELHVYRGVFGSHVANVLRRLRRVALFHGAKPRFVGTSATIANPEELASTLFGGPVEVIRQSGAPSGPRHFLIYNPPPIDESLGIRESYLKAACKLTADLVRAGVGTLVFCRSRQAVEVLVHYLRETLAAQDCADDVAMDASGKVVASPPAPPPQQRVRGYRGGYLPDRRRGIERALRQGDADVVVATSALELGIDIGSLDAVVLAGWPGSRAAAWQRSGRAGRRHTPSLTVLISTSDPIDQFVANAPDYLFGQAPEHARCDPDNASILIPHVKCAAFELPFVANEPFGSLSGETTAEVLSVLAEASLLHRSTDRYHYVGAQFPANDVSLRGPLDQNFLVVDQMRGSVLAEVDYRDAPQRLHDHAIYQLEGQRYQVHRLDHDNHKAYVSRVDVDYYTEAMTHTRLRILERGIPERPRASDGACPRPLGASAALFEHGEVHVLHRVVGFKKIKLFTHENIGFGDVHQPDRQMHTTAMWLNIPPESIARLHRTAAEIAAAAIGLAHTLHSAAALTLMSDSRDLGRAVGDTRSGWFAAAGGARSSRYSVPEGPQSVDPLTAPVIFLYDQYPGGTGLSERLFDERRELIGQATKMIARCACDKGCPACVGPGLGTDAKRLAGQIAQEVTMVAHDAQIASAMLPNSTDQAATTAPAVP